MIKGIDVLGASIVLSSYLFFAVHVRDFILIFVIVPFFFGIAVSMVSLSSYESKKWVRSYQLLVTGIFIIGFIFFVTTLLGGMMIAYAAPVILASSSLIMAYFARDDRVKTDVGKCSPA